MINLIATYFYIVAAFLHPFHVSVCDVEYSSRSSSLQVSQRIFLDDFEQTLSKKYKINLIIDDQSTAQMRDSLVQDYVFEHFNILIDGKSHNRAYVGNETEEDAMWIYFEYPGVKPFKNIQITSTVLIDAFEDQSNIIHFKFGEFEKSVKLDTEVISKTIAVAQSN